MSRLWHGVLVASYAMLWQAVSSCAMSCYELVEAFAACRLGIWPIEAECQRAES